MINEPSNQPADESVQVPKAVIVLGMHRSGTSALSGTLGHLGGVMPRDLLPPTYENSAGYWESRPIVTANNDLLAELNHEPELIGDDPQAALLRLGQFYHLPASQSSMSVSNLATRTAQLGEQVDIEKWVDRLCSCVRQEFEQSGRFPVDQPMIIKDPRMCRLVPIWMLVFKELGIDPAFIIAVRHPSEVAGSLETRRGIGTGRALWLWMDHLLQAEHDTRGLNRVFVNYSEILADWRAVVSRIDTQLDLHLSLEAGAQRVDDFLNSKHRNYQADESANRSLPDLVARAYTQLDLACLPGQRLNTEAFDQIINEFAQIQELTSAWIIDAECRCRQAGAM